jgi:hypothetical protein
MKTLEEIRHTPVLLLTEEEINQMDPVPALGTPPGQRQLEGVSKA